jgi:hypothetical protein
LEPGYDRWATPVGKLLQQLLATNFKNASPPMPKSNRPKVMLDDLDWKPTTPHPFPEVWPVR